jgi:excisionase family DNA binding protein
VHAPPGGWVVLIVVANVSGEAEVHADAAVRAHLQVMLGEHVAACARNGWPVPHELLAVGARLTKAHEGSEIGGSAVASQAVSVDKVRAAEMLGVSRSTVTRMVADGRLPSFLVGRRRLIPVAALEAVASA